MHALFVAVLMLAAPPPRPARTPPPKILSTRDALSALAAQARAAVHSGGLDLVQVNVVDELARATRFPARP